MVPNNDKASEVLLMEQARINRARAERMEAEVEKLRAEIRKLSAERELQALSASKLGRNLGPWGWVIAICAAALTGGVVAELPAIFRVMGAAC